MGVVINAWRLVGYLACGLAGLILGLSLRRAPPAEVREVVRTQTVEVVKWREREAVKLDVAENTRTVWRTREIPGKETVREVVVEKVNTVHVAGEKEAGGEGIRSASDERIKEAKPLPPPDWSAAAFAGWDRLSARPTVYGAQVDRRVLGPAAAGVFVLRQPSGWAGGVTLRIEF